MQSGALHLAQRVPDHGTADTEFRGQIDLGGQAVGIGVAAGAQFFQTPMNSKPSQTSERQLA